MHYVADTKSQHSAAVTAMSVADTDPDMELVRKLHLELNGSGRRTRGGGPPPSKRFKRDTSRGLSEGGGALQVLHLGGARSKLLDASSVVSFSPQDPRTHPPHQGAAVAAAVPACSGERAP